MKMRAQGLRVTGQGRVTGPSPLLHDTKTTLLVKSDGKTLCCTRDHVDMDCKSQVYNDPSLLAFNMSSYHNTSEHSTRQRLRPWLESRINSGDIPGLAWVDREQKIFKVPWKHVGNREWQAIDATIFKEWAIHTGRYREGVDTPDYPTWKTRFRCALTKLPDILELKEHNNLDGQQEDPYRVYRFLPRNKETTDVPTPMIFKREESTMDMMYDDVDGPVYHNGDGHTGLPTIVMHGTNGSSEETLDSDLNHISTGDLIKLPSGDIKEEHLEEIMEISGPDIQTYEEIHRKARKPLPGAGGPVTPPVSPLKLSLDITDKKLYLTIRYRQDTMFERLVSEQTGCRIYHDPNLQLNCTQEELQQIFGPVDAMPINLPECSANNEHQYNMTTKLLNVTDRGVFLSVENGDIYAIRKCRCTIFISSPSVNDGQTTKLNREEKTKIFDINEFLQSVNRYLYEKGAKPSAQVVLGFGQRFDLRKDQLHSLLISATIVHVEANNLLTKIACWEPPSRSLEISKSNSCDRQMDMIQFRKILETLPF